MRDRRTHVLSGSICVAVAAAFAFFPCTSLAAQQADKAPSTVPGRAVPEGTQAKLDQLQAILNKAESDKDAKTEAAALIAIGEVYLLTGDSQTAMERLSRALPIVRSLGLKQGEAIVLLDMGFASREASKESEALEYDNRALSLFRELGDRKQESNALNNMGIVYYDLGQNQKALEYYSQALAGFEELADPANVAMMLNNMGRLYHDMGQGDKSLELLNRAIPLFEQTGSREPEGRALKNIGNVYRDRGDREKALDAYGKALAIMNEVGDRSGQAMTLDDIGSLRASHGERQEALDAYKKALSIAAAISEPLQAALVYSNMMHLEKSGEPALAIYYGKQAVNLLQQVRGDIRAMDKELQNSFLNSKADYYHDLADLLIEQGRLPEAQQVLDLLKQEEYKEYVRGDTADVLSPVSLTPMEQKAEDAYQQSSAQVISTEQRWAELKKISARSPEQEAEFQTLSGQLNAASSGLNAYYGRLYELFGTGGANNRLTDVKGNAAILNQAVAGMPRTVALYTSIAKDRYSVIVISGVGPAIGRKYDISEKDLNQKIAAFQRALRSPASDPRPQAQELYKILIGPIQADLDQGKAETLVWSLDGALRYIPIAALYDGTHYVVERYNVVTFTPASVPFLRSKPDLASLSAVAMGISRKYQDGLNPLPTVVSELDDIVKDPAVQGASGVLPGTILLNGQFTEKAMESQLSGQHTVVHLASHFVLQPGDDSQSYLLLAGKDSEGSGYHLTVADFRDNQNLSLTDTELLTLSACETGVSSLASNGREVDGLATTAQLKGAKAVLSTLWPVNDRSTGELMADFYRRWTEGGGKVTKVEALRAAQLDLLRGKSILASGASTNASSRGVISEDPDSNKPASAAGFAHPFYWAPFVLMGNWR
jgi:CHAT domain-containing protein/Tfp pilus assembly protein PilF